MDIFIWIFAFIIAYWWHFQRETPREREYKQEQQRKAEQWNKYNMNSQQSQQTQQTQKKTSTSDWDKHNMDSFK